MLRHSYDSQPQSSKAGVNRQVNIYNQINVIYVSSECSGTEAMRYQMKYHTIIWSLIKSHTTDV